MLRDNHLLITPRVHWELGCQQRGWTVCLGAYIWCTHRHAASSLPHEDGDSNESSTFQAVQEVTSETSRQPTQDHVVHMHAAPKSVSTSVFQQLSSHFVLQMKLSAPVSFDACLKPELFSKSTGLVLMKEGPHTRALFLFLEPPEGWARRAGIPMLDKLSRTRPPKQTTINRTISHSQIIAQRETTAARQEAMYHNFERLLSLFS